MKIREDRSGMNGDEQGRASGGNETNVCEMINPAYDMAVNVREVIES